MSAASDNLFKRGSKVQMVQLKGYQWLKKNAATQLACGAVTELVTVFPAHTPASYKACLEDDVIFVASLAEISRGSDRLQDMKEKNSWSVNSPLNNPI